MGPFKGRQPIGKITAVRKRHGLTKTEARLVGRINGYERIVGDKKGFRRPGSQAKKGK